MESWQALLRFRGFISLSKAILLLRGSKIIFSLVHAVILRVNMYRTCSCNKCDLSEGGQLFHKYAYIFPFMKLGVNQMPSSWFGFCLQTFRVIVVFSSGVATNKNIFPEISPHFLNCRVWISPARKHRKLLDPAGCFRQSKLNSQHPTAFIS